ncbi:MAG: glycosyltransferase family 9 protein [Burkholderiales bacterium]|nr:glycosyltransferase family 9 protein [Burkholderiales bacterium]
MIKDTSDMKRFLVIRTDFLGDSVLTSVFIRMLSQIPDVIVDSLCFEYNFAAFKYNPHLAAKYYLYKAPIIEEEKLHNQAQLRQLGSKSYTAVFMLNRDLKTYSLLKYISTNKVFGHRLGIKSTRSKLFCLITELLGKYNYIPYDNALHEVVNQVNLLRLALPWLRTQLPQLNNDINSIQNLTIPSNCYFYTESFNPENDIIKDKNKVVVNISGRRDTVRYLPLSLARCIIEDLLKLNLEILVVATKDDELRAQQLLDEIDHENIGLCTETDLFKVSNLMSRCLYYIGADGGLLHIAAGLHMHCIGLFHAQNIRAWHPWSKRQICLQSSTKKIYDLTSVQVVHALKELG